MTQLELKEFSFKLINTLVSKQCYIKGYGTLYRVCDKDHNPVINITKQQMQVLKHNEIIHQDGLTWILDVDKNPFDSYHSIKLHSRNE